MSYIVYQQKQDIAQAMLMKLIALSNLKQARVHIALSGGSTPKSIFSHIVKQSHNYQINWSKLHFWWCDERCVEPSNQESNFGEAKRHLFDHIDIPDENLHPMVGGNILPEQAALAYVQEIKRIVPTNDEVPCFDWVWLGMGDDGHTASLFVNGLSLNSQKTVDVAEHPATKQTRITLTLKVLNNAKTIDFLVTGENKAQMVEKVLCDETGVIEYPAKFVGNQGELIWHLDQQAASKLENKNDQ